MQFSICRTRDLSYFEMTRRLKKLKPVIPGNGNQRMYAEHEMGHICYWVGIEKISILNQINAMKLYKRDGDKILFWETWDIDDKSGAINQGTVGEVGQYRVIESGLSKGFRKVIQKELDVFFDNGYQEVDIEDHYTLLIEYLVDGMGTPEDVEKQTRLEDRMNEFLGWNGLGHCDGGSIGSGTMEVWMMY